MSGADSSQGPGWWQASDGKWYPPEQRPGGSPSPTPSASQGPSPTTSPTTSPYPTPGPAPIPSAQPLGATGGSGEQQSFFARLFDMSFTSFITPSIIKILFILGIVLISIVSLFLLIGGAANAGDGGIVLVLIAPIYWLFGVVYMRVLLEVIIVFFRIEANTRKT
jgi:hypothetical protein